MMLSWAGAPRAAALPGSGLSGALPPCFPLLPDVTPHRAVCVVDCVTLPVPYAYSARVVVCVSSLVTGAYPARVVVSVSSPAAPICTVGMVVIVAPGVASVRSVGFVNVSHFFGLLNKIREWFPVTALSGWQCRFGRLPVGCSSDGIYRLCSTGTVGIPTLLS